MGPRSAPALDLLAPLPPDRWGSEPDANAFVELHNLVAAAEHASDIGPADTARIARERGVDLTTAFRDERVGLYVRLFRDAEARTGLVPDALRRLGHLARTLALDPADVRAVHTAAFGWAVEAALADDCLTVEERLHLHALQQALGLDAAGAAQTVEAAARRHLLATVARVLCDGRLSPDEAADVARAVAALGVAVPAEVAAMLNRAASAWEAARPLPAVATALRLSDGERAYADLAARWAVKRSDALAKALAGAVSDAPLDAMPFPWKTFLSPVRTGRIVLTDARLVLLDDARATGTVPVAAIDRIAAFADAVVLRVQGDGRRILIDPGTETGPFARTLRRAIADRPGRTADVPLPSARWRVLSGLPGPTRAGAASGWEMPGHATVEAGVIELANVLGTHAVPARDVAEIVQTGALVGIREGSGRGYTVRFDDEREAHAFAAEAAGLLRA